MPSKSQDAIALLKADHRTVEDLFRKYESAKSADRKRSIAQQICTELVIHTMIEEEIFYPAIHNEIESDLVEEAYVEHDSAKVLISDIMAGSPSDEFFDAKVAVLADEILHHIHEEEKRGDGMFAQARASGVDLRALGEQLAERKAELQAEFKSQGAAPPMTRTLRSEVAHGPIPVW